MIANTVLDYLEKNMKNILEAFEISVAVGNEWPYNVTISVNIHSRFPIMKEKLENKLLEILDNALEKAAQKIYIKWKLNLS